MIGSLWCHSLDHRFAVKHPKEAGREGMDSDWQVVGFVE